MSGGRPHELALPATALAALRQALAAELGPQRAAAVLQQAGYAAGDALAQSLVGGADAQATLASLGAEEFWRRLSQLFAARGWGSLAHVPLHPGVSVLESPDWGEADTTSAARRPSCFFSTGVLANLLGQVAGAEVAVLEVECRSRGDDRCRFMFGSPQALQAVHAQLVAGETPDAALTRLG